MGNLYETIQALCQAKGIRPGKMCNDLGLSRSLMTDLKMGRKKTVNAETARKLAAYLGVSVEALLGSPARDVLEEVDIAFYGDFVELSEEQKEAVREMVHLMRQRRNKE